MDSKHDLKHQNRLKTKKIYFVSRKITENCTLDSILETSDIRPAPPKFGGSPAPNLLGEEIWRLYDKCNTQQSSD